MELISDRLLVAVEYVYHELEAAMKEMAAYVETIERTPMIVESNHTSVFSGLSIHSQELTNKLSMYGGVFDGIDDVVHEQEDSIELLANRYLTCARRQVINTTQAMEQFHRSRSTIYRWIKKGKLLAEKQGRRWAIFV